MRGKKRRFTSLKILIIIVVLILSGAVFAAYHPELFYAETLQEKLAGDQQVSELLAAPGQVNIVLLGFDRSTDRESEGTLFRPDTIIVISLNDEDSTVSMVSIPRDSYVLIQNRNLYDKINHSYMHGYFNTPAGEDPHQAALASTVLTIADFLGGVPLHGYLTVDMDGAAAVVDALGGVEIDIAEELRGNYGRGSVQLEAGSQHLDGRQFLTYVRNRADYLGGERGRTLRQQEALIALFKKAVSPKGLFRLPRLYRAIRENVETSLRPDQLAALALAGFRVNRGAISSNVFSGEGRLSARNGQNIWYLVINEEARVELIKAVFGLDVASRSRPDLSGPLVIEPEQHEDIVVEESPEEPPVEVEEEEETLPDTELEPETEEEADLGADDAVETEEEATDPNNEEPVDEETDLSDQPVP